MLQFKVTRSGMPVARRRGRLFLPVIESVTPVEYGENRNAWDTWNEVETIAAMAGPEYMATDRGEWMSPRFDVIKRPKVGDLISYAFNGDYYPCGEIATISKTSKKITSTTGHEFFRRRMSAEWVQDGTWSMVPGHIKKLNPEL